MPKQLPIITHPNPILRKKSLEINLETIKTPAIQNLLKDMEETMKSKDGAGLAAPQVSKNIRVIVISYNEKTIFLINPKITKRSWARETEEEGCLSVLNEKGEIIYAPIERHKRVSCIYLNEFGQVKKVAAERVLARILQHEIDHLDGILFIDRIKPAKTK